MNEPKPETATVDLLALKVVNRVAMGTVVTGHLECDGGIIVEGIVKGSVRVRGSLILTESGLITGNVHAEGTGRYILAGRIGDAATGERSQVLVGGTLELAGTFDGFADITAGALKNYHGAELDGRIRTTKKPLSEVSAAAVTASTAGTSTARGTTAYRAAEETLG